MIRSDGDARSRALRIVASLAERGAALSARIRASAWVSLGGRVAAIAAALLVLGWIGRTATAPALALDGTDAGATDDAATSAISVAPAAVGLAVVGAAPDDAGAPASSSARGRASPGDPVYLNVATADELRRLPGVGPKRAQAIVALRQRLGRFQRVEDLMRVKGIGRTTLKKWRALVRLDTPEGGLG